MQNVEAALLALLRSRNRDLVDVYEFYSQAETDLVPENASKLFAPTSVVWNGNTYQRQTINRADVSRFKDEKFNSVNITLSNVDRTVGAWLTSTAIEGYRVVVRLVSRSVDDDSLVLFVGRCEKPVDVDNTTVSIQAKQDLGSVDNDLPWGQFSETCQVAGGFKGVECLAGESLGSKSAAYQAATACDFSHRRCTELGNTDAFQAQRFQTKNGKFKLSQRRGGAGGAFLSLAGLGNKRVSKQWTSQDDGPYGKPRPLIFGRVQAESIPIQHADTGEYIAGVSGFCEGPVEAILNPRCETDGFKPTFQAVATHRGEFGTDSEQDPAGFFASNGDKHSHLAYIEYTVEGNNPDTGEPAPTTVAVIMGMRIPVRDGATFSGEEWSDNPVEIARFLLTEARSLNYSEDWIDDEVAADTAANCDEPMKDESFAEQLYLSDEMTANAGVDFKNYRSTGRIDTHYYRKRLGLTSTHSAELEADYNFFDAASAPSSTSIAAITYFRKRYTANVRIAEPIRVVDFLYKKLLPSFRGYFITGADGRLQIRNEREQLTQYLRGDVVTGGTTLAIEDAAAWKALNLPVLYALVGVGLSTAEAVEIDSIDYSTAGNSITLSAGATGGGATATASGATLSGGSTSAQASGTVTIGGAPANGNTITATIDGVACTYTLNANDTTGTAAAMLAVVINTNATLKRYVKAEWSTASPTVVTIKSKLGVLNLATALANDHDLAEEVMHVHMVFSAVASGPLTRGNILKDTFKWPLGNRQTTYNQFIMDFTWAVQDFQPSQVIENDYTHQALVNKKNKLEIDGSCIDNYPQANLLVQAARYKYRDGDSFCSLAATGLALLLEEGDVICVTHPNMPNRVCVPFRLEDVKVTADHRVHLTGRLYSKTQFPETATPKTVSLVTAVTWPTNGPGAVTSLTLTTPVPGTVRGTFSFANYVGSQTAKVEVLKPGAGAYVDTGIRVSPDASNNGAFEMAGLGSGTTSFKITPLNSAGIAGSSTTGSITVANPLAPRIEPGLIASTVTFYSPTVS